MCICINNDLIWVSIPRCASTSIEKALLQSKLNLKHYAYGTQRNYKKHTHIKLSYLYQKFGIKETVCIKRDYFERWLSGLRHIWVMYDELNIPLKIPFEKINNDFIYQTFTDHYIQEIYSMGKNYPLVRLHTGYSLVDKTKLKNIKIPNGFFPENVLRSQLYETDGKKCTYEFDINEIEKFENFIKNKYNTDFKLEKINTSNYIPNQIIIDDKLKNWVWDKFEKPFIKSNKII